MKIILLRKSAVLYLSFDLVTSASLACIRLVQAITALKYDSFLLIIQTCIKHTQQLIATIR